MACFSQNLLPLPNKSVCQNQSSFFITLMTPTPTPYLQIPLGLSYPKHSVLLRALFSASGRLRRLMGTQALPIPFLNPNWSHYFISAEDGAHDFPPGWFSSKPFSFEVRPPVAICLIPPFIPFLPCHIKPRVGKTQTFVCNVAGGIPV